MILTHLVRTRVCPLVLAALLAVFSATSSFAVGSLVYVKMDPVRICQAEGMDSLTINLENPTDSIAAFQIWLQLDRPDICKFMPGFDSSGTLISGWKFVDVRSLTPGGTDVQITALAENPPFTPPYNRGFAPHTGFQPLIRIPVKLVPMLDTMTDVIAHVVPITMTGRLSFSDQNGRDLALSPIYVWDTSFYRCVQPSPSGCLQWQRVATPPWDSMAIKLDTFSVYDSNKVYVAPTTIARCCPIPLLADIDNDGLPMSMADYVALVRFVYSGETPLNFLPANADLNGDCHISWADVWLLDSIVTYGCGVVHCERLAACTCLNPVRYCCQNRRGNVTNDVTDIVDIEDLFALVDHLAMVRTAPCLDEADVDGSGSIDISDVMYLVDYLGNAVAFLPPCP